jgi:hypothetical protein
MQKLSFTCKLHKCELNVSTLINEKKIIRKNGGITFIYIYIYIYARTAIARQRVGKQVPTKIESW